MRKPRSIDTNRFDGRPCLCPGCTWARRERARRSAQRQAVIGFLAAAGCLYVSLTADGGLVVVAGIAAFSLLIIAFIAALEG